MTTVRRRCGAAAAAAIVLAAAGCAAPQATRLGARYLDPEAPAEALRGATILVVCDAPEQAAKLVCESQFSAQLAALASPTPGREAPAGAYLAAAQAAGAHAVFVTKRLESTGKYVDLMRSASTQRAIGVSEAKLAAIAAVNRRVVTTSPGICSSSSDRQTVQRSGSARSSRNRAHEADAIMGSWAHSRPEGSSSVPSREQRMRASEAPKNPAFPSRTSG